MVDSNHYETLKVQPAATQAEIKQSYRRLVKLFHPDSNQTTADHDYVTRINAAYEVLGDPDRRQSYNRTLKVKPQLRRTSTVVESEPLRKSKRRGRDADQHLQQWLRDVYTPVNRKLWQILAPLRAELDQLSADPFDDELMEEFQVYLQNCRSSLTQAQVTFFSLPNPSTIAGVAASLYHCLNHIGDGIEELERFTLNYDDYYLHTGRELFRIAATLRQEAQAAIKVIP